MSTYENLPLFNRVYCKPKGCFTHKIKSVQSYYLGTLYFDQLNIINLTPDIINYARMGDTNLFYLYRLFVKI